MAEKELTKDVEHAVKWLAAEFKYLKRLHNDLQRIENEDVKKQEKELKKDRKVIRYIGRAERRLEKDVKDVVEDIKESKKTEISEDRVQKLLDEIEIPAAQLVKEGSLYVGALKEQLNSIRTNVRVENKYPTARMQKKVKNEIDKLDSEVRKVMTWLVALDAALNKVKDVGDVREVNTRLEEMKKLDLSTFEGRKELKDLLKVYSDKIELPTGELATMSKTNPLLRRGLGTSWELFCNNYVLFILEMRKANSLSDINKLKRISTLVPHLSRKFPTHVGELFPGPESRHNTVELLLEVGSNFSLELMRNLAGESRNRFLKSKTPLEKEVNFCIQIYEKEREIEEIFAEIGFKYLSHAIKNFEYVLDFQLTAVQEAELEALDKEGLDLFEVAYQKFDLEEFHRKVMDFGEKLKKFVSMCNKKVSY